MNHRQWKKRYKKIYGHNPTWKEDKKKYYKYIGSRFQELKFPTTLRTSTEELCELLQDTVRNI